MTTVMRGRRRHTSENQNGEASMLGRRSQEPQQVQPGLLQSRWIGKPNVQDNRIHLFGTAGLPIDTPR